ncbi:MAG: CcmD family protein [Alicyclobacillus sp.]|nr:CcmD family protein [Alicyclobacillus sp.]
MQHLGYLWAAAAVVWGGTLLYTLSLVKRQARLEAELHALRQSLAELEDR